MRFIGCETLVSPKDEAKAIVSEEVIGCEILVSPKDEAKAIVSEEVYRM